MKRRMLAASFAALLIIASGVAGSFYLAGAQEQGLSSSSPEISIDGGSLEQGSPISVSGTGFRPEAEISLYVMSAAEANLTESQITLLQEISSTATPDSETDQGGNLVSDAFDALRDLLNMQDEQSDGNETSTGRVLVVSERGFDNQTVMMECDDQELAKQDVNDGLELLSLPVAAGDYAECNITISDENGVVDSAQLGAFTVLQDPDEEYEESLAGTARADSTGNFSADVQITGDSVDQYAILAVADEGQQAAVSEAFSIREETTATVDEPLNETSNQSNETATPFVQDNGTFTQENETAAVTNDTGEARVQIDEEQVEAGSPLAIQGDGFEPNTPVQVLINNVQITNIITNIQGSFNTVVIVPTTVNNGDAEVVVKTEQINVVRNVDVVQEDNQNEGPSWIRFNAISQDDSQRLEGAPVTIFDTRTGKLVESDRTPFVVELDKGKYSVFYSDFRNFRFESAEPGRWIDTPGGGSGLLTVREGRNATVTATYSEEAAPAPLPETRSTLVLRAQDTDGNPLEGMFVSVYDAETGDTIKQGFTELRTEELSAGTYPIFFANFGQMTFVSGSPGSWIQTPYGGAGLVVIPADGTSREVLVTATYDRVTTVVEVESNIQAPIDIRGHVFTITSNETRPEGPFEISGAMALRVESEEPLAASLTAHLMSAREDSNENVNLESQRSRDHDTFQIVDFKADNAAPTGPNSYIVTGTADLLLNGDMYSNDEEIQVSLRGGEDLTPTNVEIEFQGEHRYSGANRLETLYAVVTDGFQ